jgi:hypothetical protein
LIRKSKAVEVGIFIPPKLSTFRPPVTPTQNSEEPVRKYGSFGSGDFVEAYKLMIESPPFDCGLQASALN